MAVLLGFLVTPAAAPASFLFDPDSVCAPTDSVCVIDEPWEVLEDEVLDFGRRRVVVRGDGHLSGNLTLRCGSFDVDVQGAWIEAGKNGRISVTARRGCSGDASLPCLEDSDCAKAGKGTCDSGNGSITIVGSTTGAGTWLQLDAADSVTIAGPVDVSAPPFSDYLDYDAGAVDLEAEKGSVVVLAPIRGDAGYDPSSQNYGAASRITMTAGRDVSIWQPMHLLGGRGELELSAGRDVLLRGAILGNGLEGDGNWGASLGAVAGRDVVLEPPPGAATLVLRLRGAFYYGEGAVEAGNGGNGNLEAGRDIRIAEGVRIRANSGPSSGYPDVEPYGGYWALDAGRDILFDGLLVARGRGVFGRSDGIDLSAGADLTIGATARIDLRSDYVKTVALTAPGRLTIHGTLDARAHDYLDENGYNGTGGSLRIDAGDIDFGGTFATGGGLACGEVWIEACRLHVGSTGRIDAGFGTQEDYSDYFRIRVGESMSTEAGSVLAAHANASPAIQYRDAAKPPLLDGTVPANLALQLQPSLDGCPVCGNAEIDEDETCDDGNTEAGDGCSETCLLEP